MAKRRKKKAMNARRRMKLTKEPGRRDLAAESLKYFRASTEPDRRKKESREACRGNKQWESQ